MIDTTSVTQKGQVTIPVDLRKYLGISRGQNIRFFKDTKSKKRIILEAVSDFSAFKGSFKKNKTYNRKSARSAFIKDIVKGKI